jgi:hypothetical protein
MNKLFSLNIFKKSFFIIFAAALVVSGFFVLGNVAQAATLNVVSDPTSKAYKETLLKAADRLIVLQNVNGSWDWVVTNATEPTATTYYNITGVSAQALLDAYTQSGNAAYLTAAEKAGDYLVSESATIATNRQNAFNIVFLLNLGQVTGNTVYSNLGGTILNTILHADNYWSHNNGSNCIPDGCTPEQLLAAYKNYRGVLGSTDQWGIVPWDLMTFVEAAQMMGDTATAQAIEQQIVAYVTDPTYTSSIGSYALGLTGAIRAAHIVSDTTNESSFAATLIATQGVSGEFGTASDGQVQTTAYAVMALKAINDSHATDAANYLDLSFGYSTFDGWQDTDGNEYAEVDSEAAHALYQYFHQSLTHYTIQDAINAAFASDTINVAAGTYSPTDLDWDGYGFLRINRPLTLKGAGSSNTIIDGEHLYTVTGGACVTDVDCPSGKVCNLDTHKCQGPHSTCLWVGNSNVKLEGLTVKGCDWGVRASDAHSGATEISDLTFNDVTVTDNYGHGVVFENYYSVSFSNIEFTNCNANANGDRGIYISPTSNAEDFTLTNTNANGNKKAGFNCQGTLNGLTINGGSFNDNTGGLTYEGGGPYFGVGIELDGVSNAEINGIEANRNGLLGPSDCDGSMIGGAGILLKDDTSNVKILNSELKDNANGILVEWCKHWPTGSQPTDIEGNYNKIEGNTYLGVSNRAPDLNLDATKNWWGASINPADVFPAIFEDNFNDYDLGNLNGQGSWVQSGGLVNVEDSVVFEGAKAVQSVGGETGFIYEKTGRLVNNGRIVVHVESGDNNTDFQLHLREGSNPKIIFGINMTGVRSVDYRLSPSEDWQNIGTFEADTWFSMEIEWRSSDHEVRYRFNEGTWTDWVLPFSAWTSGLDSMLFTGDANCATYWDYILEYSLSGNVNFDPWYADAAMTKLAMQTTANPDGTQSATIVTGTATITQTSVGPVSVDIPAGIIITGPAGWDGTLVLPQVAAIFAQPTAPLGNTALVASAIEIGLGDTPLTFDKAVKIVFAGQAGKYVGYSCGGVFTQITATCDSPTTSTLDVGADCRIDDGADLIVWTKHFTQFITYNIYLYSPGSGSSFPPPAPSPLGDANGDKKVDKYDFSLMMANWGKIGSNNCDLNNDSKVDKYDFALLMLNWSM